LRSLSSRGFALSARSQGEADKIVQVYTQEWGRVRAVAKGARKPKSKLAASLELFTESSFSLNRRAGGDWFILFKAKVLDDYHDLKKDFKTISFLQVLAEILLDSLGEQEAHPDIYQLLREVLEALGQDPEAGGQVMTAFVLKFLEATGFPLELENCVECGTSLEKRGGHLIPHRGGALCGDCCATGPQRLKRGPAGLAALRRLRELPLEKAKGVKLQPAQAKDLFLTVMEYLERTVEKKFKTVEYYLKTT